MCNLRANSGPLIRIIPILFVLFWYGEQFFLLLLLLCVGNYLISLLINMPKWLLSTQDVWLKLNNRARVLLCTILFYSFDDAYLYLFEKEKF